MYILRRKDGRKEFLCKRSPFFFCPEETFLCKITKKNREKTKKVMVSLFFAKEEGKSLQKRKRVCIINISVFS